MLPSSGARNVGKSTLFNRILGQRQAIVEDFPGVTRDRNYAEVTRFDTPFTLIDTGGFEPVSSDELLVQMRQQSQLAVEEADVIMLVLDAKEGLTPSDIEVAGMLRRTDKPVLFVVNKVDGERQEAATGEFFALGVEELFTVSAEHGLGIETLIDATLARLPAGQMLGGRGERRGSPGGDRPAECREIVAGQSSARLRADGRQSDWPARLATASTRLSPIIASVTC